MANPPPPEPGVIDLQIQGSSMTSSMIPPSVRVNGHPVPVTYGSNPITMPPGRHHVDVHAQWIRRYGQAAIDVDVAPGQSVPVYYAMPYHQFTTGSIGRTKQRKKGLAGLLAILAVPVAIVVLVVVAAVLGG